MPPWVGFMVYFGGWLAGAASLILPLRFMAYPSKSKCSCSACQYDLKGLPDELACPECGNPRNAPVKRPSLWPLTLALGAQVALVVTGASMAIVAVISSRPQGWTSGNSDFFPFTIIQLFACSVAICAITAVIWRRVPRYAPFLIALGGNLAFVAMVLYDIADAFLWNPSSVTGWSMVTLFLALPLSGHGMLAGFILAWIVHRLRHPRTV